MRQLKFSLLVLGLFIMLLGGACGSARTARETALQEWLATAKKPVKVVKHSTYQHVLASRGSHYYTLVDSDGKVFLAKRVRFELPEVIE